MVYLVSPMPLSYDTRPLHESLGGGFRPLGAQCHPTKQVMDQHVPQHHRLDLLQPADDELVKPAVAALGVGPFTFTRCLYFSLASAVPIRCRHSATFGVSPGLGAYGSFPCCCCFSTSLGGANTVTPRWPTLSTSPMVTKPPST